MIYSMAPMEGFTGHVFRRVHAAHFGVLDCYYTPFLAPPHLGCPFVGRGLKEIDPAANEGLNVIPQLLTNRADEFVWATQLLSDMGYREVNLNLGCPSGTVVSKGGGPAFCGTSIGWKPSCATSASAPRCRFRSKRGSALRAMPSMNASLTCAAACRWRSPSCIRASSTIGIKGHHAGSRMAARSSVRRFPWRITAMCFAPPMWMH